MAEKLTMEEIQNMKEKQSMEVLEEKFAGISAALIPDRKERLLAWIKKHRLPVTERADKTLVIGGNVTIAPPYEIEDCDSPNPRTLKSIHSLIRQLPLTIEEEAAKAAIPWNVGNYCRALYPGSDSWYDVEIKSIDGDKCTVLFMDHYKEVEVDLKSLEKSLRKKAIKAAGQKLSDDSWKVGDVTQAMYPGYDLWHDVKVIAIDGDKCTIKYIAFDKETEVDLKSLKKSLRKKGIKIKQCCLEEEFSDDSVYFEVGEFCWAVYPKDGAWHHSQIVSIEGNMCSIISLGENKEAKVHVNYLEKSLKKKEDTRMRGTQKRNLVMTNVEKIS